ncbi:hypothetical protein H4217_002181 [Coemansia sp. RSA 1939]|nr:hypothetical protein H4217_002181 [Coemansia sp. RSA 1939]KAJ2612095.1 hypothetical protein EV177_003156 [Coemansia sp. RSA 1804]
MHRALGLHCCARHTVQKSPCASRTFGAAVALLRASSSNNNNNNNSSRNGKYPRPLADSSTASTRRASGFFMVVRIDTNGVEHPMNERYSSREDAQGVADEYERLGHKNGYFVRYSPAKDH